MPINLSLNKDRVIIDLKNVAGPVPKVHEDGTFTTGLDCDYESLVILCAITIVGLMFLGKRLNREYTEDANFMTDVWTQVDGLIKNMNARIAELQETPEAKEEV